MNQNQNELNNIPEAMLKDILLAKSNFIGQLVHNLKNPIGSGLSFSEMILDDVENLSPEKLKRYLSIIKESCDAAITQLEVLLIESKIETNTLELYKQETYFSKILATCLELNSKSFEKNKLILHSTFLQDEPLITIDKKLINLFLQSIFQFYIQNASYNTNLLLKLEKKDSTLIFTLESDNCTKCLSKYEALITNINNNNIQGFSSSINKFLSIPSLIEIAKLHEGTLNFSSILNDSVQFKLTLPIPL